MALLTTVETKILLQIASSNTDKDQFISDMIPIVEDVIRTYCDSEFASWPAAVKFPGAMLISHFMNNPSAAKSDRLDDHSVSYSEGLPKTITDLLDPYLSAEAEAEAAAETYGVMQTNLKTNNINLGK